MATGTLKNVRSLNDISDDEIRKTFSFLPHIVKIVKAASTSSATEPLLLKNSIQELKDQLLKAHMLIERADFLNTTPEQQAKQLETIREKIKDRMELMEKYSKVDYDHLMRNP
jgi:hypothetical protein